MQPVSAGDNSFLVLITGLRHPLDPTSLSVSLTCVMRGPVYVLADDVSRTYGTVRIPNDLGITSFPEASVTSRRWEDPVTRHVLTF